MNKHLQKKTVENYKENKDIMSWNPRGQIVARNRVEAKWKYL